MGEGHIQKFTQAIQRQLIIWIIALIVLVLGFQWCLHELLGFNSLVSTIIAAIAGICGGVTLAIIIGAFTVKPTRYLAQAIMHISPSEHLIAAPNIDELKLGHDLVENLTRQVYSYATVAQQTQPDTNTVATAGILDQLPVAIIGLDSSNTVQVANKRARTTIKNEKTSGQKLTDLISLQFENGPPLDEWIAQARENSVVDFKIWEAVEINTINNEPLGYFDIAVSFSGGSSSGVDIVMALYDHSDAYNQEDTSMGFVALSVHEMRTPVTIMRGYIEAFEDELEGKMTPQLADDLSKMNASADALTSFVSNILNVARINQGQLSLKLEEHSWNKALPEIVDNLRNRAAAYGKSIELRMVPDMPNVAIDRMTIGEVITNLIDNAIKYAPDDSSITIISQINREGLIETTVQDHGVGIPETVMPHLFSKFYRNHRNRNQIGGTGLGLFLSKTIVNAHKGNIWANSKEGEGSIFGFTLLPYSELATELQSNDNEGITRSSHGWIKNHSMQRR